MDEVRPWVGEARLAREKIAQTPRGERDEKLQRIAAPRKAQTLRRAIAAVDFLDKLQRETKFPVRQLERLPVAAIEYLLRWYKRDPTGALKAGEKLLRGEYTAHGLGKAERESRTEIFAGTGKALEADYRRSIADAIEDIARAQTAHRIALAKDADLEPYGWDIKRSVDFAFLDEYKRPLTAFVVVGPYRDPKLYQRRCFDWVAKANAIANIFDTVFLIVPDNGSELYFNKLRQNLRIDPRRLRIKTIRLKN
jgi:hypothetical protein